MTEKDKNEETVHLKFHQKQGWMKNMANKNFNLGRRMAVVLLSSIFLGELVVMFAIHSIQVESYWISAPIDSLLLSILIFPAVYFFVIRPMTIQNEMRNQAEITLNNSLSLTEATLESIHNGILVINDQGSIVKTNSKFGEMWHIPQAILDTQDRNILLGHILEQLSSPEWFTASISELYSKPEAESFDLLYFKDGRIFERISKPFYLEGKPKGRVWSFLDVTENRRVEQALRNSETHLRTLVQTIPDLIWLKNKDGIYLSCNAMFERFFGAKGVEIIGKTDYDFVDRELADFFRMNDRNAMESGKPTTNEEWITFADNGQRILLETIKTPMYDLSGDLIGILGIGRDITERKLAETEITTKNKELIQAHAEKDKFFSIIAHDLRSPFNSFLGLTQIMAEEWPTLTAKQVQEIASSMKNSATNLHRLLENLLEWSRIQQGLIPFNPNIVQLLPLISESISTAMEPARNKGIIITYNIPDNLNIYADKHILQTVIRNLVSNAVKFTPRGGTIKLTAKATNDNCVEISVEDSGIGMSREMVDNLFKLDVQIRRKGTEEEPSTGLGLMLCKEFIEKHGGKLWVESKEGKGSIFYFTIATSSKS